jgi:hypothetical protein
MSPEAQAKTEADAQRLGEKMDLAEVRRALKLSQGEIRQTLELVGTVAKIEKRADMYVSTLRRFVEAMGGELEIVARFADHLGQDQEFCRSQREEARQKKPAPWPALKMRRTPAKNRHGLSRFAKQRRSTVISTPQHDRHRAGIEGRMQSVFLCGRALALQGGGRAGNQDTLGSDQSLSC